MPNDLFHPSLGTGHRMPLDSDLFRSVLGRFATGVTVVTMRDADGRDHGMTVSAFSSLSLDPPLVLFCIDRTASMAGVTREASYIAVNILSASQEALSRRFSNLDANTRFDGIGFSRAGSGAPILDDVLAHLECEVLRQHDGGDHLVFVAEVRSAEARDERPLLYYRGGYAQLER
ncbi:MAG: flavin reductase family protein [Gemmatimonadaceae bacterium]